MGNVAWNNFADPERFESALPPGVLALVREARAGRGPAVRWLTERSAGWGQVSVCFVLLRAKGELTPDQVGWLVGMSGFADEYGAIPDVMRRERIRGPAPAYLRAFAAGLRAGVPTLPRQWQAVEGVTKLCDAIPAELVDVLPTGLCSESAGARGVAQRLLARVPEQARPVLAAARLGATGKAATRLDAALALLPAAGGEAPVAAPSGLAPLLTAWASTHAAALVDAIARVGATDAQGRPPLRAASKAEVETAWHAVAKSADPVDVPRLLGTPWPAAWSVGLDRVRAFERFPEDPRIAHGLLAAAPGWISQGSHPVHVALARDVGRHGDAACIPALKAMSAQRSEPQYPAYHRVYERAVERLRAVIPAEVPAGLIRPSAPPVDLTPLWGEVYERPRDLDARRVLADALAMAGDPRGEFIALQLSADPKAQRRAAALLALHVDAWTPAFPGLDRGARAFTGGFMTSVRVTRGAVSPTVGLPEWRMVERLEVCSHGQLDGLLARMPVLRELACVLPPNPGLVCPSVEVIGLFHQFEDWLRRSSRGSLAAAFPALRVLVAWLGYGWSEARWRALLDLSAGIPALGVGLYDFHAYALSDALVPWRRGAGPPEIRLAIGDSEQGLKANGWFVVLRRDDPVVRVAWGGGPSWSRESVAPLLASLAGAGIGAVSVFAGRGGCPVAVVPGLEIRWDGAPVDLFGR